MLTWYMPTWLGILLTAIMALSTIPLSMLLAKCIRDYIKEEIYNENQRTNRDK